MLALTPFPSDTAQIDSWILARRPARNELDPQRPHAFFLEQERADSGERVNVATIFLTNRECPWRCLMCDLWRNTLPEAVPTGAIPAQIDYALARLPTARQVKLYNSGSFFDRGAIPPEDYPAIAQRLREFNRVIVESHPALVGEACLRFRDLLELKTPSKADTKGSVSHFEVAMGLETAHPDVLARLNKRMTLDQFARAAAFLRENRIALRAFILVKPPFLDEEQALHWAKRSLDFAFDCGASVASLIPTRFGNGALEALAEQGQFSPPKLSTLEHAAEYGVRLGRGRVFADVWDLQKFSDCAACFPARLARLEQMNHSQSVPPPVICGHCEDK
jgi:radical SAM enzyme (TIGR01210 family)